LYYLFVKQSLIVDCTNFREFLKGMGEDPPRCHYCMEEDDALDDEESDLKRCGNCVCRAYCSRDCQKKDWKIHKFACALIKVRKDKKKEEDAADGK
jgi:hypothetical protein